jgi:hypothetical protein
LVAARATRLEVKPITTATEGDGAAVSVVVVRGHPCRHLRDVALSARVRDTVLRAITIEEPPADEFDDNSLGVAISTHSAVLLGDAGAVTPDETGLTGDLLVRVADEPW